jgi:tetratricopeptide (TPR) repeat protein
VRTAADLPDNVRDLVVRGRDAWREQDYDQARSLFEAALAIAKDADDKFGQAAAYHFLGNIAFNECKDEESRHLHLAALELSRADDDPQGEATSLGSLALLAVAGGDLKAARTQYDAAIASYEHAGMTDAAISLREKADSLLEGRVSLETLVHRRDPCFADPS